jgi:Tfp pilus assembly protein PilN
LAKLPRAGRDLKALREQFDRATTVVSLSGLASDSDGVYRYLGELGRNRLFAKVDLVSLDNAANAANRREDRLEFKLSVVVRPGYGLPDGPAAPPPDSPETSRKGASL